MWQELLTKHKLNALGLYFKSADIRQNVEGTRATTITAPKTPAKQQLRENLFACKFYESEKKVKVLSGIHNKSLQAALEQCELVCKCYQRFSRLHIYFIICFHLNTDTQTYLC